MRTRVSSTLVLAFAALLSGCSSTRTFPSGVSPKMQSIASIGDKPLPVVGGEPGAKVVAESDRPARTGKPEGRISGRVVDAQGDPVPNATVRTAITSASKGRVISTTTNKAGAFTLNNLRPGSSYTLIAEWEDDSGLMTGRLDADAPEAGIKITVAPEGGSTSRIGTRKKRVSPISEESAGSRGSDRPGASDADVNSEDVPAPAPETDAISSTRSSRRTRAASIADEEPSSSSAGWHRSGSAAPRSTTPTHADDDPAPAPSRPERTAPKNDELNLDDDGENPLPPALEREHSFAPTAQQDALFAEAESPPTSAPPGARAQHDAHVTRGSTLGAAESSAALPLVEASQISNAAAQEPRAIEQSQADAFRSERAFAQAEPAETTRKRTTWEELDTSPKEPAIKRTTMSTSAALPRPKSPNPPDTGHRLTNEELLALPRRGEDLEPPEPKPKPIPTIKAYCRIDAKRRQLIDFQLPDLEGRPVRFQDYAEADLILLDFWGTWCPPCMKSVPHLVKIQKIADAQKARGLKQLQVIGINCEKGPNAEKLANANRAIRDLGINYPVLMSGMESDPCPVLDVFNIQYFPTMVLLDREGHVLWADQGATPATLARLDAFLANAMKGTGSKRP